MSERELRKQLTIMVYSFIFKKILPTMDGSYKIGNIEYAIKLNSIMNKRSKEGYKDTFFESFDLFEAKSEPNLVKDSNFNNWVNGTSNPKSYEIINALIEYVYETCQAEERLLHLKIELLSVITNTAFSDFCENRIDRLIEEWIDSLRAGSDITSIFYVLKNVLYLLKDKNRHIAFLLHSHHRQSLTIETTSEMSMDIAEQTLSIESEASEAFHTEKTEDAITVETAKRKFKLPIYLVGIGSVVFIFLLFLFVNQILSDQPKNSSASTNTAIVSVDINADSALTNNDTIPSTLALDQTNQKSNLTADAISSTPSISELNAPLILEPVSGLVYDYTALHVKWESVELATTYDLALKNATTEEIILEEKDIHSTEYTIDSKYLLHGAEYKLYIIAKMDYSSSESSIVNFTVKPLESPTILTPIHLNELKMSDISVKWTDTSESDTYKIVVTDIERWVKVYEKEYINATSCILDQSIFIPGISYRIYLCSQNSSSESIPNYIDIKIAPLESPVITAPIHNTILDGSNVTLTWEKVDFASYYKVDILETNSWETVYSDDTIYDTTLTLDHSLFKIGGSYRIYLFSLLGTSSSTPTYLDLKAPELLPPEITQPQNNAILPLAPITITWNKNLYADTYTIVMTDTTTWEQVIGQTDITDASFVIDKSLLSIGSTYRIYVKSNSDGIISAPNYIDIKIDGLPIPNVLIPKRNTTYEDQDISIEWEPISYITTYKITITDLSTWQPVYTNSEYTSERITVDKKLLQRGNSYRVYIQSIMGTYESEPAIIDFTLTP